MKPTKLRFKPGQFIRLKRTSSGEVAGQLYCIMSVYRLTSEPAVWRYVLEERGGLAPPGTELSAICAELVGEPSFEDRIIWQPIPRYNIMGDRRDYCHGDRVCVTTQQLLNGYTLVSDGEVLNRPQTHGEEK